MSGWRDISISFLFSLVLLVGLPMKTVASRQEIVSLEREEQTCLNGMDVLVVLIFITIEAIVGVFQ